jgi:hypothetical protein
MYLRLVRNQSADKLFYGTNVCLEVKCAVTAATCSTGM